MLDKVSILNQSHSREDPVHGRYPFMAPLHVSATDDITSDTDKFVQSIISALPATKDNLACIALLKGKTLSTRNLLNSLIQVDQTETCSKAI